MSAGVHECMYPMHDGVQTLGQTAAGCSIGHRRIGDAWRRSQGSGVASCDHMIAMEERRTLTHDRTTKRLHCGGQRPGGEERSWWLQSSKRVSHFSAICPRTRPRSQTFAIYCLPHNVASQGGTIASAAAKHRHTVCRLTLSLLRITHASSYARRPMFGNRLG